LRSAFAERVDDLEPPALLQEQSLKEILALIPLVLRGGDDRCASAGPACERRQPHLTSGSGRNITAGWRTLVRVWTGREICQYVDGHAPNPVAVTATSSWSINRQGGWQFSGSQTLTCRS